MTLQGRQNSIEDVFCLVFPRSLLQWMKQRIFAEHSCESCGFLSGCFNGQEARVEKVLFATNLSESPDYFSISPKEQRETEQAIEAEGKKLIGVFHSHRHEAWPSDKDKENMSFFPLIWLILGETEARRLEEMVAEAFKPIGSGFQRIAIRTVEDISQDSTKDSGGRCKGSDVC